MMRSLYHDQFGHPVLDLFSAFSADDAPCSPYQSLEDLELDDGVDVMLLDELEKTAGVSFQVQELDFLFGGELDLGYLCEWFDGAELDKEAAISSAKDKARSMAYRAAHKEEIKRKSKKRRALQSSGKKMKMKRVGSAATGYTFVPDAGTGAGSSGGSGGGLSKGFDFNPHKSKHSLSELSSLSWKG